MTGLAPGCGWRTADVGREECGGCGNLVDASKTTELTGSTNYQFLILRFLVQILVVVSIAGILVMSILSSLGRL